MMQLRATLENLLENAQFESLMETSKLALADARKTGDRATECLALIGLAQAHKFAGKFQEARVLIDGALQTAVSLKESEVLILCLLTSGSIFLAGNFQAFEAEREYRSALNFAHDLSDLQLVSDALAGLASVYVQLGEDGRAGRYAREAVTAAQDVNYRYGLAVALSLAGAAAASHQAEIATQAYEDAIKIAKEENFRLIEANLVGSLGQLLAEEGRYQREGLQMLEKALETAKAIRSIPHEYTALYRLGRAYEKRADFEKAADYYSQLLAKAQEWRTRAYEGVAFFNLGILAFNRSHYDDAIGNFQQALALARETKNPFQEAQVEQTLGASYNALRQWDEALSHYLAARSLYDALDSRANANSLLQTILVVYVNRLWDKILILLGLREKDAA